MTTVGYVLILIAALAIRGLTKGRSLTDLPQDIGDLFTSAIQGNIDGVKEVAAREGSVPSDVPANDAPTSDTTDRLDAVAGAQASGKVASVLAFARAQKGKPYEHGKAGPNAYDCSGLTSAAFAQVGVKLPRTTVGQILVGSAVAKADLRPGDLVFPTPGHVQIYTGGGNIVEAANPKVGIVERPMWGFLTARRVTL